MPRNRKVTQVDPTSEDIDIYLDSGSYWMLAIILEGTTDTGQDVALSDIADHVILERNGTQLLNVPADFLIEMLDEWKGVVETTTPTAGATRVVIPVPMWYPEEELNALKIQNDQELNLQVQFNQSALSTDFGSNTVTATVRRYLADSTPERYQLFMRRSVTTLASGDAGVEDEFNDAGIVRLFVRDTSDVVTNLQVEFDDTILINNASKAAVNDLANLLNRVESPPDSLIEINPFLGPSAVGASQRSARVLYDANGAGDAEATRLIKRRPLR